MKGIPYLLDRERRTVVLESVREVCLHRGWRLLAAHVRTTQVHVIVEAEAKPEKVMNDLKSYASRGLNRQDRNQLNPRRWARHGSTRWLWKDDDLKETIRYVIEEQSEPMLSTSTINSEIQDSASSRSRLGKSSSAI